MALDVRSLTEWVKDLFGRGRLSGGGELGAPTIALRDAEPESGDQGERERASR